VSIVQRPAGATPPDPGTGSNLYPRLNFQCVVIDGAFDSAATD
jgi:hypothetical protein